jgi:hypothetical protein
MHLPYLQGKASTNRLITISVIDILNDILDFMRFYF